MVGVGAAQRLVDQTGLPGPSLPGGGEEDVDPSIATSV
jgi:hypothetical protein